MKSRSALRRNLILVMIVLIGLSAASVLAQPTKATTKTKRTTTTKKTVTTKKAVTPKSTAESQATFTLIQNFIFDAYHPKSFIMDGTVDYCSFDAFTSFGIIARGIYPINEKLNIGGKVGFAGWSPDKGDGESGLLDPVVIGTYRLMKTGPTTISGTAYISLPIGSEDIGEGELNFGFGGLIRHNLDSRMAITGGLGIKFYEIESFNFNSGKKETEHEAGLGLNAGFIYAFQPKTAFIGELIFDDKIEYTLLSAGMAHKLASGHQLRGALGLGLDDGAPDIMLLFSFMPAL